MTTKLRDTNYRLLTAWNLVSYTCIALALGAITGIGFGHYQIQRFRLLQFRHDEIQGKITGLENQLVRVRKVFDVNISNTKILKKRAFSTGCKEEFGETEAKAINMKVYEYYEKETQIFRSISGLDVNLVDDESGGKKNSFIRNSMNTKFTSLVERDEFFKADVRKWTVKMWGGESKDFSKCYFAVPVLDYA